MAPRILIAGIEIQMPTDHGWDPPRSLGTSGVGDEVLPAIWSYNMSWENMFPAEFSELWNIRMNNLGTNITAYLPEIGAVAYTFKTYTCRINPVVHQGFFEGSYRSVRTSLVGLDITIP